MIYLLFLLLSGPLGRLKVLHEVIFQAPPSLVVREEVVLHRQDTVRLSHHINMLSAPPAQHSLAASSVAAVPRAQCAGAVAKAVPDLLSLQAPGRSLLYNH